MKFTFYVTLGVFFFTAAFLAAQNVVERGESYIMPKVAVSNEVTPEQGEAEKKRRAMLEERVRAAGRLSDNREMPRTYTLPDGRLCANRFVHFSLTARDTLTGVRQIEYQIDRGPFLVYRDPIHLREEGNYIITYRSLDNSGNLELEKSLGVVVDHTPPQVVLSGEFAPDEANTVYGRPGTFVVVKAEDKLCGLDQVFLDADGLGFAPVANGSRYVFEKSGRYQVKALAFDHVGNRSETISLNVVVDGRKPRAFIVARPAPQERADQLVCRPGTLVELEAYDDSGRVRDIRYRVNDGEWFYYTQPIALGKNETYSIAAQATDFSGNESEPVTFSCVVDVSLPKSEITIQDLNYRQEAP